MNKKRNPFHPALWGMVILLLILLSWSVTATSAADASAVSGTCEPAEPASLSLVLDGAGEFCHVTSGDITYINSWNMQLVEINGVDYSNTYADDMPERQNGNYYIRYVGLHPWSHLEVMGSGGGGDKVPVTGVNVQPETVSVAVGSTTALTAVVAPESATDKSVDWRSNDQGIAVVDADGVVQGMDEGRTIITATTTDGGFEASVDVSVTLSPNPEETYRLTLSVIGDGATEPASGTYDFAAGTEVRVMATPTQGATFTGWRGAAGGTDSPVTVTMDADLSLTAVFSSDSPLPDQCDGPCNSATPVYPTILDDGGTGNVTMYSTSASSGGACNYGQTDVMHYAAINVSVIPGDGQGNWQGGSVCGQCAEVTTVTSQGPKRMVVRIMDKCPDGHCGIDLGGAAPGELMIDGFGRYQGQWRFVSCDGHPEVSDGPPTLDVFPGSNSWWSRVHVRNGSAGVAKITWRSADGGKQGTFPLASDPENTYVVPVNDVLQSAAHSIQVTVHYTNATTATAAVSPDDLATSGSYPLN